VGPLANVARRTWAAAKSKDIPGDDGRLVEINKILFIKFAGHRGHFEIQAPDFDVITRFLNLI
jgi:hypothetical protein